MATSRVVNGSIATTTSIRQNLQTLMARGASIGAILGPLVGLLIWTLPLELDPTVQRAFAIVSFMLVYWITEALDHGITALCGCFLFWVLQVAPPEVAFAGFTKLAPWFLFGVLLVGQSISQAGLAKRIGYSVLRVTGSSYNRLLLGLITLVYAMYFMIPSGTVLIATLAPLVIGIAATLGLERHSNVSRGLFVILAYVADNFGFMFLGYVVSIMTHGIILEQTGVEVLWSQWFVAFVPLALPMIVVSWLTIRWLFPPEIAVHSPNPPVLHETIETLGPWSSEEKKVLGWVLLGIALWATDFLHHVNPAAIAIGLGLVLVLPKVGVLDIQAVKSINFPLILFVGGVLSMTTVLSETGALDVIVSPLLHWLTPMLSQPFPASLMLYWGGFLYHFFVGSQLTMSSTALPILLQTAISEGYNPAAVGMLWNFAGSGKLFVYQSTILIFGYGFGMFTAKDLLKVGAVLTVVQGLFIMVLVPVYWPLVGLSWTTEPAEQQVVSVQAEAARGKTAENQTSKEGQPRPPMTASMKAGTRLPSEELETETMAWASIRDSTVLQDFVEFLAAFPEMHFAFAARMRLRQLLLGTQRRLPSKSPGKRQPLHSEGPDPEIAAWANVRNSTKPQDFAAFLAAFPETRFGFAAHKRLRQLVQIGQVTPMNMDEVSK